MEFLVYLVPFLAFVLTWAWLHRRAASRGAPAPPQWGWLAAILGLAVGTLVLGRLL